VGRGLARQIGLEPTACWLTTIGRLRLGKRSVLGGTILHTGVILRTTVKMEATPLETPQLLGDGPPKWVSEQPVQRHITWRRQYDASRYARHLSQPELNRRIRDILVNLLLVDPEGKASLSRITNESALWLEKFTHVLEEMQLRHGPYPAGFTREILHSEPFPNFASELAEKAAKRLTPIGLKRGEVFIKFGKREHMERLYESGALRIQPATYFAQTDHNGAVRDDELTLSVSLPLSRADVLNIVKNPQDVPLDAPEQRVDLKFESPTDYWLYCVTNSVEPRLFVDFNADSCVIIRDRGKFGQMLSEASRQRLTGAVVNNGPAIYFDPLLPKTAEVGVSPTFVPFVKHFRYTYQDEHRFCWLPPVPVQEVTHVDVEIGSLKEFSDLIVL